MNRRTLTKGAAWTLPAITIAAAAPSLAASPTETRISGTAAKCPGSSDAPGGYRKHSYRVTLTMSGSAQAVVPISVLTNGGDYATILTDATPVGAGAFEFVADAKSSASKLTVTVLVDGVEHVVDVKASPRCSS